MLFLFLAGCFSQEECNKAFPCEGGRTCQICCEVGGLNCTTKCSDGWRDTIPPAATDEDLRNDICHCIPTVKECQ